MLASVSALRASIRGANRSPHELVEREEAIRARCSLAATWIQLGLPYALSVNFEVAPIESTGRSSMLQVSIKTSLAAMLMGLLACIVGIGTLSIYKLGGNERERRSAWHELAAFGRCHPSHRGIGCCRSDSGGFPHSLHGRFRNAVLEKEMADAAAGLKSSLAAYDILVSSDEERANYTALVDAIEGYGALHQKLLDLSRVNRNDEAAVLFKGEMKRAFERVVSFSNKAVEINKSGGDGETTRAAEGFAQTKLIVGIAIALSILFALGATAFVVKRVSQPIAALARAMAELAEGHFDVVLPGLGRKDEIGDIAAAVEGFKIKAVEKATARSRTARDATACRRGRTQD